MLKIHIVQKGEVLTEIAQRYGVSMDDLMQSNKQISSPDYIMPGMKVNIPAKTHNVKKVTKENNQYRKPVKNNTFSQKQKKKETISIREYPNGKRPMGKTIQTDEQKETYDKESWSKNAFLPHETTMPSTMNVLQEADKNNERFPITGSVDKRTKPQAYRIKKNELQSEMAPMSMMWQSNRGNDVPMLQHHCCCPYCPYRRTNYFPSPYEDSIYNKDHRQHVNNQRAYRYY